jgi:hypothetical protein
MDYLRRAEEEEGAGKAPEYEIPDVAAETAQSRGSPLERGEERAVNANRETLSALLEEIEACHKILVAAKTMSESSHPRRLRSCNPGKTAWQKVG